MDINGVIAVAERIDPGASKFKGNSTRESRNAAWAYIIGCVYWGHPTYNSTPDPQWHIKDAGGGRPQSDDVTVSMPSRNHWDCIPGAGTDGAYFSATGHGPLPLDQNVYPPPKPDGGSNPIPKPPPVQPYPGDKTFVDTG